MSWDLRGIKCIAAVVVTLRLLVGTDGQIPGATECPVMKLAEGASPNLLSKTWYENRRLLNSDPNVPTPSCVTFVFGQPNEQNQLSISIQEFYNKSGETAQLEGILTPINDIFNSYDVQIPLRPILPKRYDILGFDPEGTWVVLWTCSAFSGVNFQQALVLSSQQNPDPLLMEPALEVLRSNNIPEWLLMESEQFQC